MKQGCDLEDPESVNQFLKEKEMLKPPIQRLRERAKSGANLHQISVNPVSETPNGELNGTAGRRGAAAALERLEKQEEESHRRLERARAAGDPFQIQAAQEFWLKCSETLRRLDLAVEVARRSEEEQIPLKKAQAAVLFAAEWFRIAFMQFLSSEAKPLMGIKDVGEWKAYAFSRFKGILDLTVINAAKTNSAIPDWANDQIKTAWNVDP